MIGDLMDRLGPDNFSTLQMKGHVVHRVCASSLDWLQLLNFNLIFLHFYQELLYDNHLCIDGSKLEESGFSYNYPELTVEAVREASILSSFLPLELSRMFLLCRWSLINWNTSIITERDSIAF